jgi:hypothetical protein
LYTRLEDVTRPTQPDSSGRTNDNGSYLETCTLPASQQSMCTVILDRFVDWYGAD